MTTPQTPTPSEEKKYRLLTEAEPIEAGDQLLEDDTVTWTTVPTGAGKCIGETWMLGQRWCPNFHVPFRREVLA